MVVFELTGGKVKKWDARFAFTKLTWKYVVLHKVAISNWMFSKNTTILTKDRVILIYRIGKGIPINLGQISFDAVVKAASEIDGPLMYPNMILQVLKKQEPTPHLVMTSALTFSKTLYTSDRVKDLPYTAAASSDEEDSTFEAIRTYKYSEGDVETSSIPNTAAVQKVLTGLPALIKKLKVLCMP